MILVLSNEVITWDWLCEMIILIISYYMIMILSAYQSKVLVTVFPRSNPKRGLLRHSCKQHITDKPTERAGMLGHLVST